VSRVGILLGSALAASVLLLPGCGGGACGGSDHWGAECREQAAWQGARLERDDYVFSFGQPGDRVLAPTGLLRLEGDRVVARSAGLGDFVLEVDGADANSSRTAEISLRNVDDRLEVWAHLAGRPAASFVVAATPGSLRRDVTLALEPGEVWTVSGALLCDEGDLRLAMLGDIQSGLPQFERIVAALAAERDEGEQAGEPLMGLVVVGDLSDEGTVEELEAVRAVLDGGAVPTAATPGNHDTYADPEAWQATFGPGTQRFGLCATTLVLLDTADAGLAPTVEERLPELLSHTGDHLLAGMHYPPYSDRLATAGSTRTSSPTCSPSWRWRTRTWWSAATYTTSPRRSRCRWATARCTR
jgi:hypothetical protein